jgi:YHS domain-containing protein
MAVIDELKEQIQALMSQQTQERKIRIAARQKEMMELVDRKALYEVTARKCVIDSVIPRLETLRQALGNGNPVQLSGDGCSACLGLRSNEGFPVGADLSVSIGHDVDIQSLDLSWKVSVIPILMEYDREASLSLNLKSPDMDQLGRFLDERVLRFVSDYLRIHAPDSPYLRNAEVVDPVCRMSFPASEAVSSITVGTRTFYFCAESCAAKFELERARFSC